MALVQRVASVPRSATAYGPSSRKQVVVRAGNAGIAPSPYGNKQWAGTDSRFGKSSRHGMTRRAVNDEASSAKEGGAPTHVCLVCGFMFVPDEFGGKAFESMPDDFKCPECSAPKSKFGPAEDAASPDYLVN
ncbi:hypothetical protein FOA52_010610 [Chlamydomonas sp. UWO 241]|nr:hypothetical protein FOA52_010610 [Chlamydomonas sp. UWO 241]